MEKNKNSYAWSVEEKKMINGKFLYHIKTISYGPNFVSEV